MINVNHPDILKKHGDEIITKLTLLKTTNNKYVNTFCYLFLGQKYRHIKPFHIEFQIETENNTVLFLEKSMQLIINYIKYTPIQKEIPISISPERNLTLNKLLANTKDLLGERVFSLYTVKYNCQHFVKAVLQSNQLSISKDEKEYEREEEVAQDFESYFLESVVVIYITDIILLFVSTLCYTYSMCLIHIQTFVFPKMHINRFFIN